MSIESQTRKLNRLRLAALHMEAHLSQPLRLDELADAAALSRYHFERSFAAYAGETPLARVRRLRLHRAREQLACGAAASILQLALDIGYASPEAFARAYRSAFGHPPSAEPAVRVAAPPAGLHGSLCRVQLPATLAGLPPGTTADDLSFQRSLEKYMALARSRGAVPVLLTPVTRIVQDKTVASHVEGAFPIARSTHVTTRGDRPGDYSATVRQAGDANQVPVIDLDALSIEFFNRLGVGSGGPEARGGWRDHYLAVWDTGRHPFYASATTVGHYLNADRTHFQEAGAVAVADLVLQGVRSDPRLAGLAALLD